MTKKKEQPAAEPIRKRFYPTLGVSAATDEEAEALATAQREVVEQSEAEDVTLAEGQEKEEEGDAI